MKKLLKAVKKRWKELNKTGLDTSFHFFLIPVVVMGLGGFMVAFIFLLPAILPVIGLGLLALALVALYHTLTKGW